MLQGDVGPFSPTLPVDVPLWIAINLKQRQKCHIQPPSWMDVGQSTQNEKKFDASRKSVYVENS